MTDPTRPLTGCRVVVTRARAGRLDEQLRALGAEVVAAPAIAFVEPDDGGRALRAAAAALAGGTDADSYDWLVVTSATAVDALVAAGANPAALGAVRIAAVGPATADAVTAAGGTVAVVPARAVGEALVDAVGTGHGRVLQVRPEVARDVVATGLRARGWTVDEVAAYRTVAALLDTPTREAVGAADVVTFTSPSTVEHLVAAVGVGGLPPVVVAIGPVTTAALVAHGVDVTAEADPHTVDGLVAAVVAAAQNRARHLHP